MPQSTRRWIEEKVKSFRESEVLPFHEILSADMVKSAVASSGIKFKDRIYTPFVCPSGEVHLDSHATVRDDSRVGAGGPVTEIKPCLEAAPSIYAGIQSSLAEAVTRYRMRLLAYCLMPNDFHLLVWRGDRVLSQFMLWLTLTHTQR